LVFQKRRPPVAVVSFTAIGMIVADEDQGPPALSPNPLLAFDNVTFGYPDAPALLIDRLSFAIPAGGFVGVTGPSGSGKSTLLRLACRLEPASGGVIRFDGRPIDRWPACRLRRQAALVSQVPAMVGGSVRDNLRLAFQFRANRHRTVPDDQRLLALLGRFGLDRPGLDYAARKLSVGQRQRLAILRALLLDPRLLMLDEPTSALDPDNARRVLDILKDLNRCQAVTVLMVTHRSADARLFTDTVRLEAP
jgi:putative ABC transport system ATP-binding protein